MSVYRYLGVHLNKHMDSGIIAETKQEGELLVLLYRKFIHIKFWDLKRIVNCITHVLCLYKITVLGSGVSKF